MKSQKLEETEPTPKKWQTPVLVRLLLQLALYTLLLFASFFMGAFYISGSFKDWVRGQAGKLRKQDRPKA